MESSTGKPITAVRFHVRDHQPYAIARREIEADSCPRGLVERGDLELAFAGVHKPLAGIMHFSKKVRRAMFVSQVFGYLILYIIYNLSG